jgi:hypothetical protein
MSSKAPFIHVMEENAPAVAAASDKSTVLGAAPFAGTYTPDAQLTGADTESRTLTIVNKGADGNGTTNIATKAFVNAVNANDFDETALTLNATAANLVVAAGDIIAFISTHVGSTGLADPGGKVRVTISRT